MAQTGSAARTKATILLADNDPDWLRLQEQAFVLEGYNVKTAARTSEAEDVLRDEDIDAVVYDIRLEDDNDDRDVSGLELAERTAPDVGKVITTKYPEDMATGQNFKDRIAESPFLSYVDKSEGIPAIVAAVKKVTVFSILSRNPMTVSELMSSLHSQNRARQSMRVSITLLLFAMLFGLLAAYTGNMAWLFGTLALSVVTVVFVGRAIE